ncbi:MAG: hypothetical protein Harvfovirus50_7 [Harvfovirus sp.]|uniref:Uncharacterized protein n=1 Tax=Harvfovirus sp. TaxID=2487768 RepID=A0A3G5A583_9VIRU|nr:MAG: hypothetical protein Harvfovirus50_7 [Harvfovirus sp.]
MNDDIYTNILSMMMEVIVEWDEQQDIPIILDINHDSVLDLKFYMCSDALFWGTDILNLSLIKNGKILNNSDKLVHSDRIQHETRYRKYDKSHFTLKDFEYLEKTYEFIYRKKRISIELVTYCPKRGSINVFQNFMNLDKSSFPEAFKIMEPIIFEFEVDSKITYSGLINDIKEYILEKKLTDNRSMIEIMDIYTKEFNTQRGISNLPEDDWELCQFLFRPREDILITNLLDKNAFLSVELLIRIPGFIKINYSSDKPRLLTFVRCGGKILDVVEQIEEFKSITGSDQQRIVIYKGKEILPHDQLISVHLTEDSTVRYSLLPSITYINTFPIKSLSDKRDTLYDLTITLYDDLESSSFNVLATLFLLSNDIEEENIFVLWMKNKGKFSDVISREMKINTTTSPFDSFTFEQNTFAVKFLIDYVYQDLDSYNLTKIVDNLPCNKCWADYFSITALQQFFNHKEAIAYASAVHHKHH